METPLRSYLTKSPRPTIRWMADHPLKACGFTAALVFLPCLAGAVDALFFPALAAWVATIVLFCYVHWRDTTRKIISLVLAVCIFGQAVNLNAEEPPKPIPPPVVIVVIIVAGIMLIYIIRLCQRRFGPPPPPPANTNNPPIGFSGTLPDPLPEDYAATWTYSWLSSCEGPLSPAGLPYPTTAMQLTGTFHQTTNGLQLRLEAEKLEDEQTVDAATFGRLVEAHGVHLGNGPGQQFFGHNGRAATQAEVPIYFWEEDGQQNVSFAPAGDPVAIAIERSPDLEHWQQISSATVSAGQRLRFSDATANGQMFYRFRPQ